MRNRFCFFLSFLLLSVCPSVRAENDLTLGAGWFDFNRSYDSSANFSGEWRGEHFFYGLRPVLGMIVNTNGGIYGYGGFNYDWEVIPHWIIAPGAYAGGWHEGHSIDLGGPLEFHESVEFDYRFDNNTRIGAQLAHSSNANIYSSNPGVNMLMAVFSFPL